MTRERRLAAGGGWKGVNRPMTEAEEERLRECVRRGASYGDESWIAQTASALGLESSVRTRGRSSKHPLK